MGKRAFGKPDDTGKAEVGDERGAVGSMATLEVAKAVKKKKKWSRRLQPTKKIVWDLLFSFHNEERIKDLWFCWSLKRPIF